MPEPSGKVTRSRYNLGEAYPYLLSVAEVWRFLTERKIQNCTQSDVILEKITSSIFGEDLALFTPWGPRYNSTNPSISVDSPEIKTFSEIAEVFGFLQQRGISIDFLLMPADIYGIDINGLPRDFVEEYFGEVEAAARKLLGGVSRLQVKTWSEIIAENVERYRCLKREVSGNLSNWMVQGELRNAIKTALYFDPQNAERNAERYCIERIVEGVVIDEIFDPIKLSVVRKEKDSLDGPLKRMYVVRNRAPWLGGGK